MNLGDNMAGPGSSAELFDWISGDINNSQILNLFCSQHAYNASVNSAGPQPGSVGTGVRLFRIIFDLYFVGLICLVGFIGR